MLARTAIVAVTTLCLCTMLSSPAAAGGADWMEWDKRYNPVGGVSRGHEDVWFRTIEAAERARTRATDFFVYLDDDPWTGRGHGPGRDAVRVGTVRVTGNNQSSNIVNASVEFEVPQLASGTYTAYFCDSGCRHFMGYLYPVPFEVVQSRLEGRLRARMDRLRRDLRSTARELRRQIGDTTRQGVARDHDIRIDLAQDLDSRSNDLDRRIDRALSVAQDRNALRDAAAWFAAGFGAAVAVAFIIRRRRRGLTAASLEDELAQLARERDRMPLSSGG